MRIAYGSTSPQRAARAAVLRRWGSELQCVLPTFSGRLLLKHLAGPGCLHEMQAVQSRCAVQVLAWCCGSAELLWQLQQRLCCYIRLTPISQVPQVSVLKTGCIALLRPQPGPTTLQRIWSVLQRVSFLAQPVQAISDRGTIGRCEQHDFCHAHQALPSWMKLGLSKTRSPFTQRPKAQSSTLLNCLPQSEFSNLLTTLLCAALAV